MTAERRANEGNVPSFESEAPGRLCFFGEHSDYLGLPLIACALPLHCRIKVQPMQGSRVLKLKMPQLNEVKEYNLDSLPPKQGPLSTGIEPDFALAAIHEAVGDGWELVGAELTSTTEFPMQAGISSSSAFCVAFCHTLAHLAKKTPISPLALAKLAHRAEVTHFEAPGGTMDHIASAFGGVMRIGPGKWDIEQLSWRSSSLESKNDPRGLWILADSGEPKDTFKHLHRCKNDRLAIFEKLGGNWDGDADAVELSPDEQQLLNATNTNRDLEAKAFALWKNIDDDDSAGEAIATLISQHHNALRDGLHLSTPRLEAMSEAALKAGAWGFKVVGSGGGGCGMAWTTVEKATVVAEGIKAAGAKETYIIGEPGKGARIRNSTV